MSDIMKKYSCAAEIEDDDELEEFRLAILKKIKRLNYMALPLSFIIDSLLSQFTE